MSSAEAEKEIKYQIDLKDLPRAPDITMLGLDRPYPIFNIDELQYYDLFNLTKVAKLLGVTLKPETGDSKLQKEQLKKNIEQFLMPRHETVDLTASPLYDPTEEIGLIVIKELHGYREYEQLFLTLYNRGIEIVFQTYSASGRLLRMREGSENLDIFRTFDFDDEIGNYISSLEYTFHDINLKYEIEKEKDRYYISYDADGDAITKEKYTEELTRRIIQLYLISQIAKEMITDVQIPLDRIINEYLFPQ